MKKSSLLLLVFALAAAMFSTIGAQASHCGSGGAKAHDPFGSCENSEHDVKCANDATDVGGVFNVKASAEGGNGVQICNEKPPVEYVQGRAGFYRNSSSGDIIIFVDGDRDVPSGGMTRIDVRPNAGSCKVQVRRGNAGSYYTSGGGMENDDVANECAG